MSSSNPDLLEEPLCRGDGAQGCKERGIEPERPYSGKLSLRLSPDLHRVAEQAATAGESIDQCIAEHLEEAA